MPEYSIRFEVPDELDALIEDISRKWVAEKVAEFVRELLANKANNGLDRMLRQINPRIEDGTEAPEH